tara:strand:- start:406 stop:1017 length:612 start_codon:yes stop_codon:yes gene_type:complete
MIRNILKTEVEIVTEDENKTANEGEDHEVTPDVDIRSEAEQQKFESDFAIKMVDTLVSFNDQQISLHELPNRFFTKDELACFGLFAKSVPLNPLPAIYPENGFLLFRGVPVPKALNLTSINLEEIQNALQTSNSIDLNNLHLSDFAPDMINAYQMGTQIYNDRLDKVRASYFVNVKNAKTQVVEVSAAVVCGFVIILTLASLV